MLVNLKKIKLNYFILFVILIEGNSPSLLAQKSDFSGTWRINKEKTEFGTIFPEYTAPFEMKVDQGIDSMRIERVSKNGEGEARSYTEKLPFDGQVIESMIKNTKKRASIKWSGADQILTETATYKDYSVGIGYTATEIWLLADGGKTLTIARTDEGDDGTDSRKMVYTRQ